MANRSDSIYQLKITLVGARPPIWRRVQVPADITLEKLHGVIQMAMGWTNSHLHAFHAGGVSYGEPDPELELKSERRAKLSQVAPHEKSTLRYEYDFGDNWEHDVVAEKILPAERRSGSGARLTLKRSTGTKSTKC